MIMELSVDKANNYGLGGAFGGVTKGPVRIFGSDPFSGLLSSFLSGKGGVPSGTLGGLLGSGTIPITIGNTTQNIPSIGVFMAALSEYTDSNIVSTPNILTLDNQEAKIEVKETVYYLGNQTLTGSGLQSVTPASTDAGLILKITPQIGEGDNLSLKIEQTLSGFTTKPVVGATLPPSTKERMISTMVVTKSGQTVVLGGLMEDKVGNIKKKVPILGDIPILGNLFKNTSQSKQKVNLLIFITPHIIRDTSDFTAVLKRKIEERNRFIEANYGKKQRSAIRDVLKTHRDDLLEYKEGVTGQPTSVAPRAVSAPTAAAPSAAVPPAVVQPAVVPAPVKPAVQYVPPPAPAAVSPVITVPSQAEDGEKYKKGTVQKPLATTEQPTVPKEAVASPVPTVQATPAPAQAEPRVKPPVINVPPPAPGTRGDELDLTY